MAAAKPGILRVLGLSLFKEIVPKKLYISHGLHDTKDLAEVGTEKTYKKYKPQLHL